MDLLTYGMLILMAFIAGTADAIAGGGGLITVPALLLSGTSPIQALGTDKLQSAIGELSATMHFFRRGGLELRPLIQPLLWTMLGAVIGVVVLQYLPPKGLEKLIPFLLLFVLLYYFISSKKVNENSNEVKPVSKNLLPALGASIGFYNGFFGPGTGALMSVALMKGMKFGIQKATMWTKPLNLAANCAAIVLFIGIGNIDYILAILMGLGSFAGGKFGANLVIKRDPKWLNRVFVTLMSVSTLALFVKYFVL